jgi:hypothetical protein
MPREQRAGSAAASAPVWHPPCWLRASQAVPAMLVVLLVTATVAQYHFPRPFPTSCCCAARLSGPDPAGLEELSIRMRGAMSLLALPRAMTPLRQLRRLAFFRMDSQRLQGVALPHGHCNFDLLAGFPLLEVGQPCMPSRLAHSDCSLHTHVRGGGLLCACGYHVWSWRPSGHGVPGRSGSPDAGTAGLPGSLPGGQHCYHGSLPCHLQELSFRHSRLQDLPPVLSRLSHLTLLNLSCTLCHDKVCCPAVFPKPFADAHPAGPIMSIVVSFAWFKQRYATQLHRPPVCSWSR